MNGRTNMRQEARGQKSLPTDRRKDYRDVSRKLSAGLLVWLAVFGLAATVGLVVGRYLGWFGR